MTRPNQKETGQAKKKLLIDSQLKNPGGSLHRYKAELKIKEKTLVVEVNSENRANALEELLTSHLGSTLENPRRIKHKQSPAQEKQEKVTEDGDLDLSPEEEAELIQHLLDQHYAEWLDSPLPILKNKTPRQAVKTKRG